MEECDAKDKYQRRTEEIEKLREPVEEEVREKRGRLEEAQEKKDTDAF